AGAAGRHRERDPRAGGEDGAREAAGDRRHPQLLGAAAARQDRPHPRPHDVDVAARRSSRRVRRSVRGVLRLPARAHGVPRRRRGERAIRGLAGEPACAGEHPHDAGADAWAGGVPPQPVRHVPQPPRHDRWRRAGARSHPRRQPPHARRRHAAQSPRPPRRLGDGRAGHQARLEHAHQPALGRRPAGAARLPAESDVTRIAQPLERRDAPVLDVDEERALLERTWTARGALRWLATVDHKAIGRRYLVTAFVFFALAGLAALLMRLQLVRPENTWVGPDLYDQLFTVHGTTMMFLFAVPVMAGLGVYLVPLMIGTRSMAFPRLIAYSYYTFAFAGVMLWVGFLIGIGPDAGWFGYVPLSSTFSPGKRVDLWADLISLTELSALAAAVSLITTIFKQRAPGMSLDRIPLYVWSLLVQSFMVVFAMPSVMLATGYLATDRLVATHLFNYAEGGDALLWQHLFWFFGHPEVYIIFVPALGIVSAIVEAFTRRPVFGYPAMVAALVATGFVSFGLWVHHMFATGLPQLGESFFTA